MYKIKICNYEYDNTYTNVRVFDDANARDTFFDDLSGEVIESCNFNANDLITTSIIFRIDEYSDISKLLNYNYAVVKDNDHPDSKPLYFWVMSSAQLSGGQMRCDLVIDFFQTYYYDINFSECMINRAHLDRFVKDEDGTYSFDYSKTSKLFEREQIKDISKRLVKRDKMLYSTEIEGYKQLVDFLNENVICWMYVYVDPGEYTGSSIGSDDTRTYKVDPMTDYNDINYGVACFCVPIMKLSSYIYVYNKELDKKICVGSGSLRIYTEPVINGDSYTIFEYFLLQNGGYTKVKNIKLSLMPPFYLDRTPIEYTVEGSTLTVRCIGGAFGEYNCYGGAGPQFIAFKQEWGVMTISSDRPPIDLIAPADFKLPQISGFTKTDIMQNKNVLLNPKMNGADYKTVTISFNGSTFEYPIDKLNERGQLKLTYYESLTPDVTRGVCRIKRTEDQTDEVYNSDYSKAFTGLIYVQDLSLPVANDQLSLYLANNKNAYLSFQNQQNKLWEDAMVGAFTGYGRGVATSAVTESPVGAISGGFQMIGNLISAGVQADYNQKQFDLTIDNMRNAPHTLQNANGNAIFCNAVSELGVYVELYEALDNELNIANDIMFENGFTYGRYGNIKDFVNTRKYFNYIEAIIDNIEGNISERVKQSFKAIFARGVRLWHTDRISYDLENYENYIEE